MALLSDIGGALSLLLGATLLTVYEVLEFAVQLGHHVTLTRRRQQHTSERPQDNRCSVTHA